MGMELQAGEEAELEEEPSLALGDREHCSRGRGGGWGGSGGTVAGREQEESQEGP